MAPRNQSINKSINQLINHIFLSSSVIPTQYFIIASLHNDSWCAYFIWHCRLLLISGGRHSPPSEEFSIFHHLRRRLSFTLRLSLYRRPNSSRRRCDGVNGGTSGPIRPDRPSVRMYACVRSSHRALLPAARTACREGRAPVYYQSSSTTVLSSPGIILINARWSPRPHAVSAATAVYISVWTTPWWVAVMGGQPPRRPAGGPG